MSARIFTRCNSMDIFKSYGKFINILNKLQSNMYRLNDSIVANKIKVYTKNKMNDFLFYYEIVIENIHKLELLRNHLN